MIARAARRGRARARGGMRDVQTTLWLARRLWRPLAAEIPGLRPRRRARTPARRAGARHPGRRA